MVNVQKLSDIITESGYPDKYIAMQLGMCRQSFAARKHGKIDFSVDEALALAKLLKINDIESFDSIFLA